MIWHQNPLFYVFWMVGAHDLMQRRTRPYWPTRQTLIALCSSARIRNLSRMDLMSAYPLDRWEIPKWDTPTLAQDVLLQWTLGKSIWRLRMGHMRTILRGW